MAVMSTVETAAAAHDTTGGMITRISEAAAITKLGINVYIVNCEGSNNRGVKTLFGDPRKMSAFGVRQRFKPLMTMNRPNAISELRHPMVLRSFMRERLTGYGFF